MKDNIKALIEAFTLHKAKIITDNQLMQTFYEVKGIEPPKKQKENIKQKPKRFKADIGNE